ncbi:fatty acid desaturase family protein [Propionibacteriaceae bacterium Y2011]
MSPSATAARSNPVTAAYTALSLEVRTMGLLNRTRLFYVGLFGALLVALGGAITGFVLLQDSWFQLLIAAALGIVFTQFAFLGHEASHRQIMKSGPANDHIGRILATFFVGISYSWWMNKHTRHHANPNKVGKDPDIEPDTFTFYEESAATRRGLMAWFTRRQGWFFFPLLLLEGINLHVASARGLFARGKVKGRALELTLLGVRFAAYLAVIFWALPLGMAFAFLGVQLAVFGVYMGASFAPNHIGMPIVPRDAKLDFLNKQVRTSRNVSGGWWMTVLLGGLNYQIEHHLFPSMPRPHLHRTRKLVIAHCEANDVPYVENSLPRAWGIVVAYLNRVGLAARHSFHCPVAGQLGR